MLETLIISGSILLSGILVSRSINRAVVVEVTDQVPDQMPDELYEQDTTSSDEVQYGSDELHAKNDALDARIEKMKEELLREASHRAGEVYDVDHSIVDSKYIPVPHEEYAK